MPSTCFNFGLLDIFDGVLYDGKIVVVDATDHMLEKGLAELRFSKTPKIFYPI